MRSLIVQLSASASLLAGPLLTLCHGQGNAVPQVIPVGNSVSQVILAWNPVPSGNVAGYNLCWGTSSGVYPFTNTSLGPQATCTVSNLAPNQVYFFVVQGFLSNGLVSPYSNEASFTNGAPSTNVATPTVVWASPAPIVYGTALGADPLNAAANVPGSFAYSPDFGAVLNAGAYTLSVIFTPADTVDYISVTNTTSLVVLPAPLIVTAGDVSRVYGAANPALPGTITGLMNGDNITVSCRCRATASSPPGAYAILPSLADPNNSLVNYTVTLSPGTLTVGPAAPAVSWTVPAPILYGAALGSNQLNATASMPGTFAYIPTNGSVLPAGTNTLAAIFTPSDLLDYSMVTNATSLIVSPAPLTVTADDVSRPFGAANPDFTGTIMGLTNGDNITVNYRSKATASSPAGTYAIVPRLVDPNDSQTNYTVTLLPGTLTVEASTSILAWANPAPILYGTELGSNQLNAAASVAGTFNYDPAPGTVLNAGTNTLSVTFTPADTNDYGSVSDTVSLIVSPAPLTVMASNLSRAYGAANPPFTGAIVGLTNGDEITVSYRCRATANSPAGRYTIAPSLVDPNNSETNYAVTLVNGALTVGQAAPNVSWAVPGPIIYGATLGSNQLNATANVPGSFAYTPTTGSVLNTGTNTLSVTFTPADTNDYSGADDAVSLIVSPASLMVTASNTSRVYGAANPVFTGAMTGLTNGDNITVIYRCRASAVSPAGNYIIVPTLVDPNDQQTNYTVSVFNGTLTVGQATPTVAWANSAPITYGAALGSNQLNAAANVPGSFSYAPGIGTVLNAGSNTLSVLFTPNDTVNYSGASATAGLFVAPGALTVTASNISRVYGAANPVFTGAITGVTNGDNITLSYRCKASAGSPVGTYMILPSLVDPNNRQFNYTVSLVSGSLTVGQATPNVAWAVPGPVIYGASLGSNQLNAAANVPGSLAYLPTNGSVLDAGTNALSVTFTPADTMDYSSVTNTVNLIVSPAPLSVTAGDASRFFGAPNPAVPSTLTGVTNGDDISSACRCRASTNSPPGTYIIHSYFIDPQHRLPNYEITKTEGTLTIFPADTNGPPSPQPIPMTTAKISILATLANPGGISTPTGNPATSIWGIPPVLTMMFSNGQANLKIGGTIGATMVIQTTSDVSSPDNWQTYSSVLLTKNAGIAVTNVANKAQNILNQAFVPAAQGFVMPRNTSAGGQFFRAVMPYDYAVLGSIVLKGQGYTPRLIVVNMPGIVCDDACYVNQVSSYIHYDWGSATLQVESSGSSIRQVADTLANSLNLDWTSASEFTFSNGLSQIWATVVRTEPASADPIAGQNPPSEPAVINF